ncbi:NAD(P)/FAD-dependent oxidoreductase [Ectothiorhodospiraceae bacterium WFHF3C12]|nr:NAD(P)/FAD-dependent oxidoreductase [Ectothiorhodospiraceae bacterium WFHF3C12]
MAAAAETVNGDVMHHDVAIIGTGFAGLGAAIRLKRRGEDDFLVFDREAGVGGTWRVNHYPGCACDVQSHLYSFSFEPNPDWTRMFAPQQEILDYLRHCAGKYALAPHLRLSTEITRMRWDEQKGLWLFEDDRGQRYSARVVIAGMGGLSRPHYPDIPGLERFTGHMFHSQQWDHDYELSGKRVAVVGTGASAIQFIPQIQPRVARLDVFQRTPQWILPRPDGPIPEARRRRFRRFPLLRWLERKRIYWMLETRVLGFAYKPRLMRLVARLALRHMKRQVHDPSLRRKLTPDYTIGCKRVLMSNDFYPALTRPNVELITDGIERITPRGIVTHAGQEREVDAIIFATGFHATDPVPAGMIEGRRGDDLATLWRDGPQAYKGTTVAGFPNLFIMTGPNTGLGHSSMVYMIESQLDYVMDALDYMRREDIPALDVDPGAQLRYNERLHRRLGGTVWNSGGCSSWYLHPVTGRNPVIWPGFTWQFRRMTRHFDPAAYRLAGPAAGQSVTATADAAGSAA